MIVSYLSSPFSLGLSHMYVMCVSQYQSAWQDDLFLAFWNSSRLLSFASVGRMPRRRCSRKRACASRPSSYPSSSYWPFQLERGAQVRALCHRVRWRDCPFSPLICRRIKGNMKSAVGPWLLAKTPKQSSTRWDESQDKKQSDLTAILGTFDVIQRLFEAEFPGLNGINPLES